MSYQPTKKQEQALREWLQEAIVPLIEQVLVQKLGQAMSFAAQEVIQPERKWVGLTDEEVFDVWLNEMPAPDKVFYQKLCRSVEAKLKEKNNAA